MQSEPSADWIPFNAAVEILATKYVSDSDASEALWRRITSTPPGLTASCRYFRYGDNAVDWPSSETFFTRLLGEGCVAPLAQFKFNRSTGDASWVKLDARKVLHAEGIHVSRSSLQNAFDLPDSSNKPSDRTGAQGRPSSMHIIEDMLRQRHRDGLLKGTLRMEAEALTCAFNGRLDCQELRKPTRKTVENNIREIFRTLRSAPK